LKRARDWAPRHTMPAVWTPRALFALRALGVALAVAVIALPPTLPRPPRDQANASVDWPEVNATLAWAIYVYAVAVVAFRTLTFEYITRVEWLAFAAMVVTCAGAIKLGYADLGPVIFLALLFTLRRFWRLHVRGPVLTPVDMANMSGKIAIVTGGNSGIGVETVRGLAARGAMVIVAARDRAKSERVAAEIAKATGNSAIVVEDVDMDSFDSVRAFAERMRARCPAVNVLVHNAGVMLPTKQITADGVERMLQTNCLSPVLLTALLAGKLRAAPDSRVVCVASCTASLASALHGGFVFNPTSYSIFES